MRTIFNSVGHMVFDCIPGVQQEVVIKGTDDDVREQLMARAGTCFIVFEGGADIQPSLYGEENLYSSCFPARDIYEERIYRVGRELGIPMLGICRGHQLMAALAGGALYQDIGKQVGKGHSYEHLIKLMPDAFDVGFDKLMESCPTGSPRIVNSLHHQAVKRVPDDARVLAVHNDGTPEALVYPYGMSVQWHPEFLGHLEFVEYMFTHFVEVQHDQSGYNDRSRDRDRQGGAGSYHRDGELAEVPSR
jgi:putative glutamine amidotransferase